MAVSPEFNQRMLKRIEDVQGVMTLYGGGFIDFNEAWDDLLEAGLTADTACLCLAIARKI